MTKVINGAILPQPSCIVIYTDGSCRPNPGAGGFAAIVCRYVNGEETKRKEIKGGDTKTTNNKMEMRALIAALKIIMRDEPLPIFIHSKSKYIVEGWNGWLPNCIAIDWRKTDGKVPENIELWQEIVRLCEGLNVTFEWVQDYAGNQMCKQASSLAASVCEKMKQKAIMERFGSQV